MYRYNLLTDDDMITGANSSSALTNRLDQLAIQVIVDVNTPSTKTFTSAGTNTTTDVVTSTTHGLTTGLKVQLTTDDTLPTGLSLSTDYFIIVVSASTLAFASSLANALAGTKIDITGAGTGTHTITSTSIAGATVTYQASNDGSNWTNLASATSITADANLLFEDADIAYNYVRAVYAITAGRMSVQTILTGRERRI